MGEAMVIALAAGESGNKVYQFTGSVAYSFYDVATVLSEVSGKPVRYTPAGRSTFESGLKERGLLKIRHLTV